MNVLFYEDLIFCILIKLNILLIISYLEFLYLKNHIFLMCIYYPSKLKTLKMKAYFHSQTFHIVFRISILHHWLNEQIYYCFE